MKLLYTLNNDNKITSAQIIKESKEVPEGYLTKEITEEEFDLIISKYGYGFINDKLVFIGESSQEEVQRLNSERKLEINKLIVKNKKLLEETDYKITKCYEAFMRQLPLPYNLEELSAHRDSWRAEINQLEHELAELE